jgi:hypothetical protein
MASADDILKGASRLFGKVGSTVKQAGKQVTGIGLGTVKLSLAKTRFAPGEAITGSITLALPEPIDGKRLVVGLRASQRTIEYSKVGGVRTAGTTTATIYKFEHEVAGAQAYASGEHRFELPVPPDALDLRASPGTGGGKIGEVARAVSSVVAPTAGPIEWRVWALLEIPWSRNLDHTVDIIVAR